MKTNTDFVPPKATKITKGVPANSGKPQMVFPVVGISETVGRPPRISASFAAVVFLLLAFASVAVAQDWTSLFNGKDFSGWDKWLGPKSSGYLDPKQTKEPAPTRHHRRRQCADREGRVSFLVKCCTLWSPSFGCSRPMHHEFNNHLTASPGNFGVCRSCPTWVVAMGSATPGTRVNLNSSRLSRSTRSALTTGRISSAARLKRRVRLRCARVPEQFVKVASLLV